MSTTAASANPNDRMIGSEEIKTKLFEEPRTFWNGRDLNRMFFQPNGRLEHQINEEWNNIPLGTVLNANWNTQNDKLCWTYSQKDVQQFNLFGDPICFEVFSRQSREEFMTINHPNVRLKPIGSGPDGPTIFRLRDWHSESYVIHPEFVDFSRAGKAFMRYYRKDHNGKMPEGTIKRDEMNESMQEYYDYVMNKIFFIDRDYMYFDESGNYLWITGRRIDEANGDIDKMMESAAVGKWLIKDNIHCWYNPSNGFSSCELVYPYGKGLKDRQFDTFLGMHHSGMSRLHNDSVEHVGHRAPEQNEATELFLKFQKMVRK